MRADLRQEIESHLAGRSCLVGVGNVDCGDDGVGSMLAASLLSVAAGRGGCRGIEVRVAGAAPERQLGALADGGFDAVLFMDAVDFGATPGSLAMIHSSEIALRFPQVSTHRISLGTLAALIGANGRTRVSLLGIQPGSLRPAGGLTGAVRQTLDALVGLFSEMMASSEPESLVV